MDNSRSRLLAALDQCRRHVLGIVEGLSEEQFQRAVLPSGWNCAGLLNHLAVDVERFWFQAVIRGDQAAWSALEQQPKSSWPVAAHGDASAVLDLYQTEIQRANEVINATALDAAPARWPDFFGNFRLNDLEEIMLHVIIETATHAGHLDAARELIDKRQWMVL